MDRDSSSVIYKYSKKQKRRNLFFRAFIGVSLSLLLLVLLSLCFFIYNISANNLVPAEEIFKAAEYIKVDDPGYLISYKKEDSDIYVHITSDGDKIIKNGYTFLSDGSIRTYLHRIFIDKTLIENVLNLNIRKKSIFSDWEVRPVYTDISMLLKESSPLIAHAGGGLSRMNEEGIVNN
ncbi:MAG: hypothetical protein IJ137_06370 [Eubacterium sp.]|nr:hypothetical protein [Eubacterium sp.]